MTKAEAPATQVPCSHEVGMSDSPRRDGTEPTQPLGNGYQAYTDPAYASQAYGPAYQAPAAPNPTEPLPPYSPYGYDPYATGQYGPQYPPAEPPQQPPSPQPPKSPRWLWIVAAVAVLVVVGLVSGKPGEVHASMSPWMTTRGLVSMTSVRCSWASRTTFSPAPAT